MSDLLARSLIRDVPDFPKPGIVFKDICPVLGSPAAFQEVIDSFVEWADSRSPDVIVGIDSRGFLFAAPMALTVGVRFVPARKAGKLPGSVVSCQYELEYGCASIELQEDAISPGQRVIVVDDVLATGGTAAATARVIEQLGGRVLGLAFVIELGFLNGRSALAGRDVFSLVQY